MVEPHQAATTVPAEQTRAVRVEIQALRALAVSLVVLYHVVPARMPGGYVGVDVFFVVSGFLITGHLLREVERTGRVRLAQFWARRARRLLPAALLVLLASAVGTILFAPQTYWQQFLREIGASALYVENWALARDAVDYLAATNAASPAQHYWSLSTEEQFYLVWPLLVVAGAWAGARRFGRRHTVAALLTVVTAASLGYSLWATWATPPQAYFSTFSRAWQFGLGGMLAVWCPAPPARWDRLRSGVSWAGFLAIAGSAVGYSSATPFPGVAALLPVLGALAVVWAGAPRARWSPSPLAGWRPVRFLGDISYSAYLWHWPAVVLLPMARGTGMGATSKVAVLAGTVLAGWLTKVLVEDPFRTRGPLVRRRPWLTFAVTALSTGAVVAIAVVGSVWVQQRIEEARAAATAFAAGDDPCFGAAALDPGADCGDPYRYTETVSPPFAQADASAGLPCLQPGGDQTPTACRLGSDQPVETVALIGDSHTASLYEAFQAVAERRNWAVLVYVKGGCPALGSDRILGPTMQPGQTQECRAWSEQVLEQTAADPTISRVFTSYRSDIYAYQRDDGSLATRIPSSVVQEPLQALADAGKRVYVVRAVPSTNGLQAVVPDRTAEDLGDVGISAPTCIANAGEVDDPCAGPREVRLVPDQLAGAAAALADPRISVIDLTDAFCDAETCHQLIGGVTVYFDASHISATFSKSLGPLLDRRIGD